MNIAPVSGAGLSPLATQGADNKQTDLQLRAARQPEAVKQQEVAGISTGAETAEADPKEVRQRVEELNAAMKQHASSILFSIDEDSGRTIVKVVDTDTDTVLRQYPSKELLAISKQIDKFQGMFIKTQA
ncbi:flagellar protein FlaG|uniref:flagellar protein FlaG n=1 Tax=Noviherbaspirillum sp. L7-7A TaxID=2850560 RepID=UPI001C2C606D|nr:flagellar protein FlaG [Noviherbaspirillum sp. L7-7A]MBV0878118.1 flagellar protein FlaG [Noviherbaspirillum sp. L7-7A]